MTRVAQVIPLRRLPTEHSWFDYLCPEDTDIQVGHLVEIPLRQQRIPGIVWALIEQSANERLRSISRVLRPTPVLNAWQRTALLGLQAQTFTSLSQIVRNIVPNYSPRVKHSDADWAAPVNHEKTLAASFPNGSTWWYRHRSQAEEWLAAWLAGLTGSGVIICPTIDDVRHLARRMAEQGQSVGQIHGQLTPGAYRQLYEAVQTGQLTKIIGTAQALFLPYPAAPTVIIDQEDHPAHKQSLRHPRCDIRQLADDLGVITATSSSAPSIRWAADHASSPPPVETKRQLARLDRPLSIAWISPETETMIDQAAAEQRNIVAIVPRRGYARTIQCRHCGLTLQCPVCQRQASLIGRPPSPLHCQSCGQTSAVPTECPRCQGVDWRYIGLGPEQLADITRQRWTSHVMNPGENLPPAAPLLIGTYQAYRQLTAVNTIAGVVIINGEALLNIPDFSSEERAWQYLARLEAFTDTPMVMVQTFSPDQAFWQRWRHGDDRRWYDNELSLRRTLSLPPITDQWMIRYPGRPGQAAVTAMIQRLKTELSHLLQITVMPMTANLPRPSTKILLASRERPIRSMTEWSAWFPSPWQVETVVTSWQD